MIKIPKIKKKISAFLRKEEGNISKKTIVTVGVIMATVATMNVAEAQHTSNYNPDCPAVTAPADGKAHQNELSLRYSQVDAEATARHMHCVEGHSSHGSHGSHSSVCSHCSGW